MPRVPTSRPTSSGAKVTAKNTVTQRASAVQAPARTRSARRLWATNDTKVWMKNTAADSVTRMIAARDRVLTAAKKNTAAGMRKWFLRQNWRGRGGADDEMSLAACVERMSSTRRRQSASEMPNRVVK